MRLYYLDQLQIGTLVKCIIFPHACDLHQKQIFIGIVTRIDEKGTAHVVYDDGDVCTYESDETVYDENLYMVKEAG